MSAIVVQIADDMVSLLNAAATDTFNEDFTAERKFVPTLTPKDIKCLIVDVLVPPISGMERISRGEWGYECPIAVGVLKKLTGSCEDTRDTQAAALALVVEQIADYLRTPSRIKLATSAAVLTRIEPGQSFNAERLHKDREFLAVVVFHYRVAR